MAEQSGFFNSNVVNGEYDRVYLAEHFAKYFANFIGNGVFGGKSNELMVIQPTDLGMKVEVLPGMAWINGYWYENTSSLFLDVSVADGALNRIDNVVVKFGRVERKVWIEVVRGTPAVNAVAPQVERNLDYYELKIAEINVNAGAINITQADINDTRLDSGVCGFVVGLIDQFDTTEFGKQLDGYISYYAAKHKAFLEELKLNGTKDVESLITRLNALAQDGNALAKLVLAIDEVASIAALLKQTVGYTKKNIIPYPYVHTSRTANGIKWTDVGDGTIEANGIATAGSYFNLYAGEPFAPGKYIISSNADVKNKYFIYASFTDKVTEENFSIGNGYDGVEIEITKEDVEKYNLFINLYVTSGTSVPSVMFEPMLRRAEILDSAWEPYKLSVADIIQENKDEIVVTDFARIDKLTSNGQYYFNGYDEEEEGLVKWALESYAKGLLKVNSAKNVVEQVIIPEEGNCLVRRVKIIDRGGFSSWEYINPPMEPNIEYRTIERYKEKPVYRKLVKYVASNSIGDSTTCTDINVPAETYKFGELVRCTAVANGGVPLPFVSQNGGITTVCGFDGENVKLRILKDVWDSPEFYFDLAYTRELNAGGEQ